MYINKSRVPVSRFRLSGFGFRVQAFGFRVLGFGRRGGDDLVLAVGVLALSIVHLLERLVERAPLGGYAGVDDWVLSVEC